MNDAVIDSTDIATLESVKQARAVRLKKLRSLSGFTRRSFAQRFQIKESTIQNWESPRHGGLTESGARRTIDCFRQLGLFVELNWLMYGYGDPPYRHDLSGSSINTPNVSQTKLKDEIHYMRQVHPDAVMYKVQDDAMSPAIPNGTVVMGKRISSFEYEKASNQICVCLTEGGEIMVRYIKLTRDKSRLDMIALNALTSSRPSSLYSRKINVIAPVFWLRYPD